MTPFFTLGNVKTTNSDQLGNTDQKNKPLINKTISILSKSKAKNKGDKVSKKDSLDAHIIDSDEKFDRC